MNSAIEVPEDFATDTLRVLLVEDDEAIAGLVRTLLGNAGYEVVSAATGRAALAALEGDSFDLVLLDLMLPDMSGLEICSQLRGRPGNTYLPILVVTGLASEAQRVTGFAAGADDYITKPFHPQELASRVRVWGQTRRRLVAYQRRVDAQARALQEAGRRELTAQLDGIKLAARELTDVVNNRITVAKTTLELVESETGVPATLQTMASHAQERLVEAAEAIQRLARVVEVRVKQTPTGPALDLARSTKPRMRRR
ncbi:MAG TPA: response regulator [Chloroflexota bacterium]|nr:response regulator [Chloroflexota bacterium]